MEKNETRPALETSGGMSRRRFISGLAASTASASLFGAATGMAQEQPGDKPAEAPKPPERKIKLGIIGCGGRGSFLAGFFRKHGGYEIHAVADYFPEVVNAFGNANGVDKARCFSTLSGYKRVIESGIEAIAIEDVPCFYAEQAEAAVAAGLHVYMAKPIAADVPSCLSILASGKLATKKNLCFLMDYQMPTDPVNIEVAKRIWDGALGRRIAVTTLGGGSGATARPDPPKDKTIESRLRGGIWNNDIALSGEWCVAYDVHCIDAAVWVLRRLPVSAAGYSRILRPNPQSDMQDVEFVTYEFEDGMLWNHQSLSIPDHGRSLVTNFHGDAASAQLSYWGKSFLRGGPKHYGGGEVESLYDRGAVRNIAEFYNAITEGRFDNPTVQRSVDSTLTAILGREAALRGKRLTMAELIKENAKIEPDLTGLKT
ncbi:MAG TPA: Gfo/Idh/MocA family oxidoreductase [Candidatus Brocadiia bacterium]|nr:Gfo/Idh/MocA family oxidoreductase [Candidatus Brocadiia bacterium]